MKEDKCDDELEEWPAVPAVCVCVCAKVLTHMGVNVCCIASMSADLSGHRAWLFSNSHGGSSTQEAP